MIVKMIQQLLNHGNTCFTFQEIFNLYQKNEDSLRHLLTRYKKQGILLNPKQGIRTLPHYNQEELASKLFPGWYLSLERVLFDVGVNFQRYAWTQTVIWTKNTSLDVNDEHYLSYSIKSDLYHNSLYIQEYNGIRKAMPERALCDLVYLNPNTWLDNPQYFQTDQSIRRLKKLLPFYPKSTQQHVMKFLTQQI